MNKKGATIVELVVSVTILTVIVMLLFQTIISLKEVYNSSGIKTEMLNKQSLINKMINDDLRTKKIELATTCGSENACLAFYFQDGTQKTLELIKKTDTTPAYFVYGDYKTELVNQSNFGSYEISSETLYEVVGLTNDSILNLNIPITHPLLNNQDYGIKIVYPYNSKTTSITDLSIEENIGVNDIYLAGSSNMVWYSSVDFVDPGYFYLDENKNLVKATDTNDAVLVTRSDIIDNKMTITYKSKNDSTITATRTVTFIDSEYNYEFNNSYYIFNAPVSGTYKIETWGANGNSSSLGVGGKGAYTSGEIKLTNQDKLYLYVGGAGTGDNGGYNGGGSITANQSTLDGAAGGGASDIRLVGGNWDSIDGLRSRIMVAAGGGGASSSSCGSTSKDGGPGGVSTSSSATKGSNCTDSVWTLAGGATQSSGGNLAVYDTSGTLLKTYQSGIFGKVDKPSGFEGDIKFGGGGGYYGGASSGYGSFATGGSSFVSGCDKCIAITSDGKISDTNIHYSNKVFSNIYMYDGITANKNKINPSDNNNGYIRITLTSVSYGN